MWWVYVLAQLASRDPDFWDCSSGFDYVINGAYAMGMLLLGWTLAIMSRDQSRKWQRAGLAGAVGASVSAVANTLEHCAQAPLGLPYVIGLLVTILVCIALGLRLFVGRPRLWAGAGLIFTGVSPFPLADSFGWGFAVGLTVTAVAQVLADKHDR